MPRPKFAVGDDVYYVNSHLLLDEALSRKLRRRSLLQGAVVSVVVPTPVGVVYNLRNGRSHVVVGEDYVASQTRQGEIDLLTRTVEMQLEGALTHMRQMLESTEQSALSIGGVRELLSELSRVAREED